MSYPGTPPAQSSPDRTATLVASVIGVLALVTVLLVALITSDSGASALARQDTGYGSGGGQSSGGNSVAGQGGSVAVVPASPTTGGPTESVPTPIIASPTIVAPPAPSTAPASAPAAAQLRATFPTPPHTRKVTSYASLTKPKNEDWYVSTSSLATVHKFYVNLFKKSGWTTYIKPSVYTDSKGRVNGFFSIYHLREKVTADLSLDKNYLEEKAGTVLIRTEISDD